MLLLMLPMPSRMVVSRGTPGTENPATPRQIRPSARTTAAEAPRSGTARTALSSVRCNCAIQMASPVLTGGAGTDGGAAVGAAPEQAMGPRPAASSSAPINAGKERADMGPVSEAGRKWPRAAHPRAALPGDRRARGARVNEGGHCPPPAVYPWRDVSRSRLVGTDTGPVPYSLGTPWHGRHARDCSRPRATAPPRVPGVRAPPRPAPGPAGLHLDFPSTRDP